jgi:hypothetical protein
MSHISRFQDWHWIHLNKVDIEGKKVAIFLGVALFLIGLGLNGCASKEEPEEPGRYYGKSYSIKFPKGWEIDEQEEKLWVSVLIPRETTDDQLRFRININIIESTKTGGLSLEQHYQKTLDILSKSLSEFQVHEEGRSIIEGIITKWYIYSYKIGPLDVKSLQYIFLKGRRIYSITCGAGVDEFDQYRSTFEEVAKSFKFK